MDFSFRKVDFKAALEIVSWKYPAPYELYNLNGSALALVKLMDGNYFSAFAHQKLIGFFCYGSAAQLMGKKDHPLYDGQSHLDIGLGLHPGWCNRGLGLDFVRSGLRFARAQNWLGDFRLTVAANNPRALKIYLRLGFQEVGRIAWDENVTFDFLVMTLDNFEPVCEGRWGN